MSRTDELVALALLSTLTLVGALLWAGEGLAVWLGTGLVLCF